MTRERIEDMREAVLPFVTKRLMETNYENLGESDAKEFTKDFNEILALAIKGLEQEPKLMVEIDLYSVIKQKYIEREVLDKIREQIKSNLRGVEIALEVLVENDPLRPKMEGAKVTLEECLELIDKAEAEADNG